MKKRTANSVSAVLALALAIVAGALLMQEAGATNNHHNDDVEANARADATAEAAAQAGADANASAEAGDAAASSDNSVEIGGDSVENNSSNVVLVPNNNTESCVRVFGLAFGKNGESGAIGFPWRSKACDYEQAADDAFAAGERELGWFWKCQNKSLAKVFRLDGMGWDEAKHQCHLKAVGTVDAYATIDKLKSDLAFIQNERRIEQEQCKESVDRCTQAWSDSASAK